MQEEFICKASVLFRGKELALNQITAKINLEEIAPIQSTFDPASLILAEDQRERRKRLLDLIAATFAHALTEALFSEKAKW